MNFSALPWFYNVQSPCSPLGMSFVVYTVYAPTRYRIIFIVIGGLLCSKHNYVCYAIFVYVMKMVLMVEMA